MNNAKKNINTVDDNSGHKEEYVLEEQVGFLLRQVNQRHATIFANENDDALTPTQFSALVKLNQLGSCSQNQLGRYAAMDVATIKGVIDRLKARGLVHTLRDANDKRRVALELTAQGRKVVNKAIDRGFIITEKTLEPLSVKERNTLLGILKKLR